MREILFRGKMLIKGMHVTNDDWVYGAFCPKSCYHPFGPMVDIPSIIKLDEPCDGYWFEVDPATVGQYTGLTDKNGKRIFEGDVVAQSWYDHDEPIDDVFGEVVYCTNDCSFYVLNMGEGTMDQLGHCKAFAWEIEVCGNIHDNPELLEGGEG